MSTPRVSALLSTYNTKAEYLREAIDSILAQDFEDFELVIIDDGSSSPEVKRIVKSYQDSRIIFTENERNLGIPATRNKLFGLARGEYLAIVDHDDISMPDRFRKQVEFLDAHPEVGVVGSFVKIFPNNRLNKYPEHNDIIEEMLILNKYSVHHATAMLRKSVFSTHNICYNLEFPLAEDYRMFCDLIGKTKFANIQKILLHYRWSKQNISYIQQYKINYLAEKIRQSAVEAHPIIWARGKNKIVNSYYYKFFGFLPIMTVRKQGRKTLYLLFGFLPVLKRRYRDSVIW